jgi:hypothetical protein
LLTGSRPIVYCRGDRTNYGDNLGYGGSLLLYDVLVAVGYPDTPGPGSVDIGINVKVGYRVESVHDNDTDTDVTASFETVITVDSQIQQIDSADYTGNALQVTLRTLTNASTSPSD